LRQQEFIILVYLLLGSLTSIAAKLTIFLGRIQVYFPENISVGGMSVIISGCIINA